MGIYGSIPRVCSPGAPFARPWLALGAGVILLAVNLGLQKPLRAQTTSPEMSDISGEYDFLNPDNTLALLDEDGELKGYIDVLQGPDESDAILSFTLISGSRKNGQVEFRTQTIHEKYYRFSGTVERGPGKARGDPAYLQLSGELQTITENSVTGQKQVVRQKVIFRSKGKRQEKP